METGFDHNKLLKKIAKDRLSPEGIIQAGRSRTFLYDNGWWTIVIEFQSSSWSKGSYLNIGVDFNFYPRDYFAFSYGSREKGFEEANDENHFTQIINDYCDFTIEKVKKLKIKFNDIWTATNTFKKGVDDDPWDHFSLGVLYGLTGNLSKSKKYLRKVSKEKCEHDYEFERKKIVTEILGCLNSDETFLTKIKELINQARQLKKLPVVDLGNLRERKTMPIWNSIKQCFGAWRIKPRFRS